MQHRIKTYNDSGLAINFCELCSKEGRELLDPCTGPIQTFHCDNCGYTKCKCDEIKEKFKKAVDKSTLRN